MDQESGVYFIASGYLRRDLQRVRVKFEAGDGVKKCKTTQWSVGSVSLPLPCLIMYIV